MSSAVLDAGGVHINKKAGNGLGFSNKKKIRLHYFLRTINQIIKKKELCPLP